jgi:hypothetical protein
MSSAASSIDPIRQSCAIIDQEALRRTSAGATLVGSRRTLDSRSREGRRLLGGEERGGSEVTATPRASSVPWASPKRMHDASGDFATDGRLCPRLCDVRSFEHARHRLGYGTDPMRHAPTPRSVIADGHSHRPKSGGSSSVAGPVTPRGLNHARNCFNRRRPCRQFGPGSWIRRAGRRMRSSRCWRCGLGFCRCLRPCSWLCRCGQGAPPTSFATAWAEWWTSAVAPRPSPLRPPRWARAAARRSSQETAVSASNMLRGVWRRPLARRRASSTSCPHCPRPLRTSFDARGRRSDSSYPSLPKLAH